MKMKYAFVSYGYLAEEWLSKLGELGPEMDRVKKEAKEKGFHLKYWGHPYGVSENIMVVWVSDKGLDAYHALDVDRPYAGNRTILAYK